MYKSGSHHGSADVEETLPCASTEPIDQRSEPGVYTAQITPLLLSVVQLGAETVEVVGWQNCAPSFTVVKRPGENRRERSFGPYISTCPRCTPHNWAPKTGRTDLGRVAPRPAA